MSIHITVSASGTSKKHPAKYIAQFECNGQMKKVQRVAKDKHTANQAYLIGLINSLRSIKKPELGVVIHTASKYLRGCVTGSGGSANAELRADLGVIMQRFKEIEIAEA